MYNLFCICASRVSRKGRGVFPCLVAILLFASCQSYKKVPYLQDAKVVEHGDFIVYHTDSDYRRFFDIRFQFLHNQLLRLFLGQATYHGG